MASIQPDPSGNLHISFRFGGHRFKRSLKTTVEKKAQAAASLIEENIRLEESGRLPVPEDVDIPTFLLSDGRLSENPKLPRKLTLATVDNGALLASLSQDKGEGIITADVVPRRTSPKREIENRFWIPTKGERPMVDSIFLEGAGRDFYLNTSQPQRTFKAR